MVVAERRETDRSEQKTTISMRYILGQSADFDKLISRAMPSVRRLAIICQQRGKAESNGMAGRSNHKGSHAATLKANVICLFVLLLSSICITSNKQKESTLAFQFLTDLLFSPSSTSNTSSSANIRSFRWRRRWRLEIVHSGAEVEVAVVDSDVEKSLEEICSN